MNPSSELSLIRARFAKRFMKVLLKINAHHKPISECFSSAPAHDQFLKRRRRRIKLAADRSMARAVRSRRVMWRRAVLRRTRNCRARPAATRDGQGKVDRGNGGVVAREAEELRKVVPGGEDMSMRLLVDEAAHYAQCLTVQVQVMTAILHCFRSNI